GNVIGSNLFNTLTVIGIAGVIAPFTLDAEVISRDGVVMGALTLSLFLFGYGWKKKQGRLSRTDGAILLACYLGYSLLLATSVVRDAT
ncbi:MAG: calcium/sodium antiporter, partial [Acidobacteria bacterium]|nr:calcium/sodium antiporter [Acidobacteriota bacterium]